MCLASSKPLLPEAARTDSHFQQAILEIPCVLAAAREDIFLAETG